MKAVKGNKEYSIDDSQKKGYQDAGFDIYDENGEAIGYGRGKTVPYDAHMEAVREIERLQAMVEDMRPSGEAQEETKTAAEPEGAQEKKAGSKKAGGQNAL